MQIVNEDLEDSRIKVARARRAKMKARLIDALLRVCAENENDSFVIEDIIKAADVSRGTFYKYYKSLDELMLDAGGQLSYQITQENISIAEKEARPLNRTSIGLINIFTIAVENRHWSNFLSRMLMADSDKIFIKNFASDEYLRGRDCGDYDFENIDAVVDVTFGAIALVLRAIAKGEARSAYIFEACVQILLSLGAGRAAAVRAVDQAMVNAPRRSAAQDWRKTAGETLVP
jgi:AcrR family transcriptional regulator